MKLIILFFLFFSLISFGQNIKKHKWENRVLLISSEDRNSEELKNQIAILTKNKKGLKERDLITYSIAEDSFRVDFNQVWFTSNINKRKFKKESESFKIILIGLDGGIKHRQTKLLSLEKLFAIIDGMPMRKRALKNKQ